MGIWVGHQFSWVGPGWQRYLRYIPDTPVTEVRLYHDELELVLICHDAVDFHEDIYRREIKVENLSPQPREIRLFFGLDLGIAGNDLGDTAGFDPKTGGGDPLQGARHFLVGGRAKDMEGQSVAWKGLGK